MLTGTGNCLCDGYFRSFSLFTTIPLPSHASPGLEGQFDVVSVPEARGDISLTFSPQDVLPVIFPLGERKELPVCDELLKPMQEKAKNEGIELEKGTKLSMKVNVHAESTLLAYHLQHPNINPYRYLVDRNSLVMDAPPFSAVSILSQNLFIFHNSSPRVATTKSISSGLAIPAATRAMNPTTT